MAQIIVSLNVLTEHSHSMELPMGATSADLLTTFLRGAKDATTRDSLLMIGYKITNFANSLYELEVRTGDVLVLMTADKPTAPVKSAQSSVALELRTCTVYPTGDVIEVSDNVSINTILSRLSRLLPTPDAKPALYRGRYINANNSRLTELGLDHGDLVGLTIIPTKTEPILILTSARAEHAPFRISASPTYMGSFGAKPESTITSIDITELIPRRRRFSIQGPQVEFLKIKGVWHVQLLPHANTPVFLDSERLFRRKPKVLTEDNVLSFGSTPTEPLFTLVVQASLE